MYKCRDHGYTLEEECPKCGKKTKPIKLPKFNPGDKYEKHRRMVV